MRLLINHSSLTVNRNLLRLTLLLVLLNIGFTVSAEVPPSTVQSVIEELVLKNPSGKADIEKGVRQAASLWQEEDGDSEAFSSFCRENYISDSKEREDVFLKISDYMEAVNGHFSQMSQKLGWNVTIDTGPIHPIDYKFSSLGLRSNLSEAYYKSKIAFIVALNFPKRTLQEKEALGDNRLSWAYARMGDIFTERIPTEIRRQNSLVSSDGDRYIDAYNIYMGKLLNTKGKHIFPEDMMLLCHWNLRDEIKANYNKGKEGAEKQRTVYEVMKRIIAQDIPKEVINTDEFDWNPYTNTLSKDGKAVTASPESFVRYEMMLNNFHAMQRVDKYMGNTFIDRKFNDDMEVALNDVETLFDKFLSAPELKKTGELIKKRLGRKLEAYDIWYDGFKARADLDEDILDKQIRKL